MERKEGREGGGREGAGVNGDEGEEEEGEEGRRGRKRAGGGESGGGKRKLGRTWLPHTRTCFFFQPLSDTLPLPLPKHFPACPFQNLSRSEFWHFPSILVTPSSQVSLTIASYGQIGLPWAFSPSPGVCEEAHLPASHTQWGPTAGLGSQGTVPRVPTAYVPES